MGKKEFLFSSHFQKLEANWNYFANPSAIDDTEEPIDPIRPLIAERSPTTTLAVAVAAAAVEVNVVETKECEYFSMEYQVLTTLTNS